MYMEAHVFKLCAQRNLIYILYYFKLKYTIWGLLGFWKFYIVWCSKEHTVSETGPVTENSSL
jgi:hypothetical protein